MRSLILSILLIHILSARALAANSAIALTNATSTVTTATSIQATQTIDPSTAADMATILGRRRQVIVQELTGGSDIPKWLSTQKADGSWPDVNYATGCSAQRANWPAQVHWQRIATMTGAWTGGVPGADISYIHDDTILAGISLSMNYWFGRDLTNLACLDLGMTDACPCDPSDTTLWNTNWFSNIILIPVLVSETCLLLNDSLSTTQLDHCTNMTGRAYARFDTYINGLGFLTGANTLDVAKVGIDQALLTSNATLITDAYRRIHAELTIKNAALADGIRPDGTFGQHEGVLYNGNYGKDYTNDILDLEFEASQTLFEANEASRDAFTTLIDGSRWMIFENVNTSVLHWDFATLGRFISFPVIDNQATGSIKINLTAVGTLGSLWNDDVLTNFDTSLSVKSSNANVGRLIGNRMFFNNDYMVHRGEDYVTTLKMYSTRSTNTECLNLQNPFGFHLADGAFRTYIRGDEYEDIAASWDWNLIPGITVDYSATLLDCNHTSWNGTEPFVGGASDGNIGIAVMRYTNPYTQSLHWQKTWFFLEEDVQYVMISALKSTTDAPVYTVLDQRRHKGDVVVNGKTMSENSIFNQSGVSSLWHGGVGYVFDQNCNVTLSVQVGEKTGNWSAIGTSTRPPSAVDLFAAWLTHGSLTQSVAYAAFPGTTDADAFKRKSSQTLVQSVKNDQDVSAIADPIHHTVMVAFWNPAGGSVQFPSTSDIGPLNITSNGNVVLIYNTKSGNMTVSDPSQQLNSVVVVTTDLLHGKKSTPFVFPQGGLAGSSVTQHIGD